MALTHFYESSLETERKDSGANSREFNGIPHLFFVVTFSYLLFPLCCLFIKKNMKENTTCLYPRMTAHILGTFDWLGNWFENGK